MNKHLKRTLIATCITGVLFEIAINHYVSMALKRNKKKYTNTKREQASYNARTEEGKKELRDILDLLAKKKEEFKTWQESHTPDPIYIRAQDNVKLFGELYKNENSSKYIIIAHGYNCTHEEMLYIVPEFYNHGFNVLVPDMRACGKSEGTFIGMGWLERLDMISWCNYINETDPDASIALYGQSMGAACVMMATGERSLPANVKVCVEDSGYISVKKIFETIMRDSFHLPNFPFLYAASSNAKRRAGYSFNEASAIEQIQKSKTPTMFIHAKGDSYIPYKHVRALYDAARMPKAIYTVPGAEHVCAVFYDWKRYFKNVFSFMDRYI